ncbi:MAG: hypothetical protein IJ008_00690 [Clostridia bacterium]|nr:hypothetical protein [Clostridia bacterium]
MKKLFIYFLSICCFFNMFLIVGCKDKDVDSCKHDFYSDVISESTCKDKGMIRYTCDKCQYTYFDDLKLVDHDYESSNVGATCTEEGYTLFECTVCGKTHKNNFIPANGNHNHKETDRKKSTCLKQGYIEYTCDRCGDVYKQTLEISDHEYEKVTINGVTIYSCKYCGKEA